MIGGESIIGLKFPSADKTGIKIKLSGGAVNVKEGETSHARCEVRREQQLRRAGRLDRAERVVVQACDSGDEGTGD